MNACTEVSQMSNQELLKVSSDHRSLTAQSLPVLIRHGSKRQAIVLRKMPKIHVVITGNH